MKQASWLTITARNRSGGKRRQPNRLASVLDMGSRLVKMKGRLSGHVSNET